MHCNVSLLLTTHAFDTKETRNISVDKRACAQWNSMPEQEAVKLTRRRGGEEGALHVLVAFPPQPYTSIERCDTYMHVRKNCIKISLNFSSQK